MNRKELEAYILNNYHCEPDHPWIKYPDYEVFRHISNKKWFAVVMSISGDKLGRCGKERTEIVNLKCDPLILGSMLSEKGFFPAYHMSKANWITATLDGSSEDDKIRMLLDMSFSMTGKSFPFRHQRQE